MNKLALIASVIVSFLLIGFISLIIIGWMSRSTRTSQLTIRQSDLASVSQQAGPNKAVRINPSLIPPTNKWFSSLVFGDNPQPIFALPLALKFDNTGFGLNVPKVTTSADTITAPYKPDLSIKIDGSNNEQLNSYDDLSISVDHRSGDHGVSQTKVSQGSPFVFLTVAKGVGVSLNGADGSTANLQNSNKPLDKTALFQVDGQGYAIFFASTAWSSSLSGSNLSAISTTDHSLLVIAGLPDGLKATQAILSEFQNSASAVIAKTDTSLSTTPTQAVTELHYVTTNHQPTLVALLPHQQKEVTQRFANLGHYQTALGEMNLVKTDKLNFKTALLADTGLPLQNLTSDQQKELVDLINADTATLDANDGDSYFASKKLFRAGQLLRLAHTLNLPAEAELSNYLRSELTAWLSNPATAGAKAFYYDTSLKGMVGVKTSFGSEEFNDHYFHYGYFIDAAAALAEVDPGFKNQFGTKINLLVADIANPDHSSKLFPYLRYYDTYAGHSWASGFSQFADGNNQESSSEAINAWLAISHWGTVSGNHSLTALGKNLAANEAQDALAYYLNSNNLPTGYNHNIVSLLWSGKRDYATWFGNHPEQKLGIQLLPFTSASGYLAQDLNRVKSNLSALNTELAGSQPVQFQDSLIMYQALVDKDEALRQFSLLTSDQIDSGQSKSFIFAWIATRP